MTINKLNLLPWREEKRKKHQQRFLGLIGGGFLVVSGGLWGSLWFLDYQSEIQTARNQQFRQEIAKLDRQLSFLPELDQQRRAIDQRLNILVSIQQERNRPTQLLSWLPALVSQGVYLDNLDLRGNLISLKGVSDSNGRLAAMLSNAEKANWTKDIAMHSIIAIKGKNSEDQTQFSASFQMIKPMPLLAEATIENKERSY